MFETEVDKPVIKARPRNTSIEAQAIEAGFHPILARILASRPLNPDLSIQEALSPKLNSLISPDGMADMGKAANRVVEAIINGEIIGLETDHDCDGQTSHAVLYYNLVLRFGHPKEKIRSYIGHRLVEGYGLSDSVASRILADDPKPNVLITADNGSSDEPRIARLKAENIEVIVTDHHEIPFEGYPKSAYACLNPTRQDCGYIDPYIAGCMVAWLLMASVRQKLIQKGYLPFNTPNLSDSLDFVAVGTIADCVSLARSHNNRAVVAFGMRLIEAGKRPCWRIIKETLSGPIRSEDLGFRIGPLLNSDGRLATAFNSVSLLLSETDEEARAWVQGLQIQNTSRKHIQRMIVEQGLVQAKQQVLEGRYSLCIFLPEGHTGVHGIAASRIKETFGRPTAFFAPKVGFDKLISGSVRGIEGFHVRDALQTVANEFPELLIAFGGHKGAGGLTLALTEFECFSKAFEKAARAQLDPSLIGPVIWTDGSLPIKHFNLDWVDHLAQLEPFGREFEAPIFELCGQLKELRCIGDGTHARVVLESEGVLLRGIWFGFRTSDKAPLPIQEKSFVKVAFSVKDNYFKGNRTFDMQIVHMEELK